MSLAKIVTIDAVEDHFKAESKHLSVMTINGLKGVSQKIDSEIAGEMKHRYEVGQHVLAVFTGAIVPHDVLKEGFWDEVRKKGRLPGGKMGDRMKPSRFNEQVSEFIMLPVHKAEDGILYIMRGDQRMDVKKGDDVTAFLGITAAVI